MGFAISRYSEKGRPMTGFEPTLPPNTDYVKKQKISVIEIEDSLQLLSLKIFNEQRFYYLQMVLPAVKLRFY